VLADIRAVELERVGTGLTFDDVAAVTRIPDERVIARAEGRHVTALSTDDRVVALAAGDRVIAGASVDRQVDLTGIELRSIDGVVTGETVDDERVVERLGTADGDLRRQTFDDDRIAAGGNADLVVVSRAVGDHGVGRAIARSAAGRC